MTERRPWARQWSRFISIYEDSGSLVGSSGINITFSGSNYFPPSGKDYRFDRLDLNFSTSESKLISLSIDNDQAPWIYHASQHNVVKLTIVDDSINWIIKKYDPMKLEVTAATGYCWYKLYVEEV